ALERAREGLSVARALPAAPPTLAQRRVLVSALVVVGNVRAELGELEGNEHAEALALARETASRDPEDFVARADLRDALERVGQAALGRHDPVRALGALEEALLLARDLRARDGDNTAAMATVAAVLVK